MDEWGLWRSALKRRDRPQYIEIMDRMRRSLAKVFGSTFMLAVVLLGSAQGQKSASKIEPIAVYGEVHRAGSQKYLSSMTLREAIQGAGGFTAQADSASVTLRRLGAESRTFDGGKALRGVASDNVVLHPGDTVFVPRKGTEPVPQKTSPADPSTRIAVLGKVNEPGPFVYRPATIGEAICSAGGLTKDAEPKRILVRRGYLIDPPTSTSFEVDYERISSGKAADVAIRPGDVIEVRKRGSKTFFGFFTGAVSKVARLLTTSAKPLITAAIPAAVIRSGS